MSPNLRIERKLNGRRIEPGAEFPQPLPRMHLQIVVVCDDATPDRWHGEVRFGRTVLLKTPVVTSHEQAHQDAQAAFEAKIVSVLSDTEA